MNKIFTKIYKKASKPQNQIPLDYEKDKFVLFSDHHKGDKSYADDFKKNATLYSTALIYYKDHGFNLIVLGDNEELWEDRYDQVLLNYKKIIQKEVDMALESQGKKKIRLWGNHDKEISLRRFKRFYKSLETKVLDNVEYREGVCLGKDIFLIHGHQGRFFDDKAWRFSRWIVQFIWKSFQKLFRIGLDGPAENFKIRDDLELKYYNWAKKNKIMLICGHTHRAIFGSLTHYDRLQMDIHYLEKEMRKCSKESREDIQKEIKNKKDESRKILLSRMGKEPKKFTSGSTNPVPCYFNDGCCCYTNGITCIEIDRGYIRLIKWQRHKKKRIVFAEKNLKILLEYIKKRKPIDKFIEPKTLENNSLSHFPYQDKIDYFPY